LHGEGAVLRRTRKKWSLEETGIRRTDRNKRLEQWRTDTVVRVMNDLAFGDIQVKS
jgi:hypothetical protein